jgi:hypothetical protein
MENIGLSYGRLAYFKAIWYILWPFGVFRGIFSPFRYVVPRKSGNPGCRGISGGCIGGELLWIFYVHGQKFKSQCTLGNHIDKAGTDFKNIFAQKLAKKFAFLT